MIELLVLVVSFLLFGQAQPAQAARWWTDTVEASLTKAGTNRTEMVAALEQTPAEQHRAMSFLIENMPQRDLESLSASFLRENVASWRWSVPLPS